MGWGKRDECVSLMPSRFDIDSHFFSLKCLMCANVYCELPSARIRILSTSILSNIDEQGLECNVCIMATGRLQASRGVSCCCVS